MTLKLHNSFPKDPHTKQLFLKSDEQLKNKIIGHSPSVQWLWVPDFMVNDFNLLTKGDFLGWKSPSVAFLVLCLLGHGATLTIENTKSSIRRFSLVGRSYKVSVPLRLVSCREIWDWIAGVKSLAINFHWRVYREATGRHFYTDYLIWLLF